MKNLKPYLNNTQAHHLCLDSLLRYSLRKDKGICPEFYYTVLAEQVQKSDFFAARKKSEEEEKKKNPQELTAKVLTFHRKPVKNLTLFTD